MPAPEASGSDWWRKWNIRTRAIDAFKTAFAAVLCLWLGQIFRLEHSYWAAVTAIVVMGSDAAITFATSRDRIIGTAIGAFLGWVTYYLWHGHYLIYGLAVLLCVFVCSALAFEKAGRLAAVTLTIVALISIDCRTRPGRAREISRSRVRNCRRSRRYAARLPASSGKGRARNDRDEVSRLYLVFSDTVVS